MFAFKKTLFGKLKCQVKLFAPAKSGWLEKKPFVRPFSPSFVVLCSFSYETVSIGHFAAIASSQAGSPFPGLSLVLLLYVFWERLSAGWCTGRSAAGRRTGTGGSDRPRQESIGFKVSTSWLIYSCPASQLPVKHRCSFIKHTASPWQALSLSLYRALGPRLRIQICFLRRSAS